MAPLHNGKSTEERLAELETFQREAKPIVDAYKAGQLVVKVFWLAGGVIIGTRDSATPFADRHNVKTPHDASCGVSAR